MKPRLLKTLSNVYRLSQRTQWRWCLAILMTLCAAQTSMLAQETNHVGHSPGKLNPADLKEKSLKELMEVIVTSVSKKAEKLSEAASAITVITQEDIRRSGATSLPEALRLAPNLEVAQVDAHEWAISARGFNSTTANKFLVLIDGRSG